jgi:glycosyltransferase involved in cell wall biosynthesis
MNAIARRFMPTPRRIGIVTTWFDRGGGYVARQYLSALDSVHDVFIYARGGDHDSTRESFWNLPRVTRAPQDSIPITTWVDRSHFVAWLETNRIEIVLFNEQHWWPPVQWCNDLGVLTCAYVDYYTPRTVPLFSLYDILICNTKRHQSVFRWHPNCYYVPWGTETDIFRPGSAHLADAGFITFFHSAGLSPQRKGTDFVLRAFSKIVGPARLVLHTQLDLDRAMPHLRGMMSGLTREERLRVITRTVSAPGLYHLGDVYVYPSRLDGIGLSVPEALACGLPVITCDHPPMNEFVDSSNGRLVPVQRLYPRRDGYYWEQCEIDESMLWREMQYFVDDAARVIEMKKAARVSAEEKLDWKHNSAGLSEIFGVAAKRVRRPSPELERLLEDVHSDQRRRVSYAIHAASPRLYTGLKRAYRTLVPLRGE